MKELKKTTEQIALTLIALAKFAPVKPALVAHQNPVLALAVIRATAVLATAK